MNNTVKIGRKLYVLVQTEQGCDVYSAVPCGDEYANIFFGFIFVLGIAFAFVNFIIFNVWAQEKWQKWRKKQ